MSAPAGSKFADTPLPQTPSTRRPSCATLLTSPQTPLTIPSREETPPTKREDDVPGAGKLPRTLSDDVKRKLDAMRETNTVQTLGSTLSKGVAKVTRSRRSHSREKHPPRPTRNLSSAWRTLCWSVDEWNRLLLSRYKYNFVAMYRYTELTLG